MRLSILAALWVLVNPIPASAEVTKVTIAYRTTVAAGQVYGKTGTYEKLVGRIEFSLDPAEPHNRRIVDIEHAPRGADGLVRFSSDLYVLRPTDPSKGNGVLLFEIANRGRKGLLGRFNRAEASNDPTRVADLGDGLLMREGYTLVWVGWEIDVPAGLGLLQIAAPRAVLPAGTAVEPLSVEIMVNQRMPEAALIDDQGGASTIYPPVSPSGAADVLRVRDHFWEPGTVIPRERWRFVAGPSGLPRIQLDGGFDPGRFYRVTYRAADPQVAGVGLAAIRDAASAFRYRTDLPVRGSAAYVFGASQSGRFLRQFLYDGFNADERDRRVFDAVWPHIAGAARGSFNERFAIPTHTSVFTPTRFPFTDAGQADVDGTKAGLLSVYRPGQQPKIFYTNTSVEYWGSGRAAALTHTSLDGKQDLTLPDNVRIYLFAGTQHGEAAFPPTRANGQQLGNPMPQREVMRGLLQALHRWVADGTAPPGSRYPRLADKTLTPIGQNRFPAIPGLADPRTIAGPARIIKGTVAPLPHLVPQVDKDGNDLAGIRVPELAVPLATSTGWNFRSPSVGNPSEIYPLLGSHVPFAATRAEREARRDGRLSIEERYKGRDDYLGRIRTAASDLIRGRYLLEEDLDDILARANTVWDYAMRDQSSVGAQAWRQSR